MSSFLFDNVAPWLPISYAGLAISLNILTLASIADATFRPVTPAVSIAAKATFLAATVVLLINAGFYLGHLDN